ncbi:MAG: TIGR02449 family protein [Rhodanobacteraceae bacterium]
MDTQDPTQTRIEALSNAMQDLLANYQRVREQNRSLLASQEQLATERAALMARNEQARSRVEAMIQRLKSLENNN